MITNPSLIEILDEGVVKGFVTKLNFTGAGVVASVVGTTGTVNASGGGGGGASATRVVGVAAFPAKRSQRINIIDAALTGTEKILAWISGIVDGQSDSGDMVDVFAMRAIAKSGSFDLDMDFLTPWAGSISIDYMVLA